MAPVMKSLIKRSLRTFDLELKRVGPEPQPATVYDDIEEASRIKNSGGQSAYRCPLSAFCTFNGFTFDQNGWHPFVAASSEYLQRGCFGRYKGSILEAYYRAWQPRNALDALIAGIPGPQVLSELPAYTSHRPWMPISPAERQAAMENIIFEENRASGVENLRAGAGYGLQGPVDVAKGKVEYARLIQLINSIRRCGYDRVLARGDVTVTAIRRGSEYRFCIGHGQHRVAVLAALGHTEVPVSLLEVVCLDEVDHWPQVYRGVWSKSEAIAYTDHLFEFDSRRWATELGLIRS